MPAMSRKDGQVALQLIYFQLARVFHRFLYLFNRFSYAAYPLLHNAGKGIIGCFAGTDGSSSVAPLYLVFYPPHERWIN